MHSDGFFFQAFVYLSAAVISVPLAKRLGLGSVLGYLLAGVAIGPFGLHLIRNEGHDVMHFAEFGVVMMLFLVGLELEPRRLWRLRKPILGLGGLQLVLSALCLGGLAVLFGLPWRVALACGLILSLSSTAIVLQTLSEKRLTKTDAGQSAFAVLLFQDIAVIPLLALLPLLASSQDGGAAAKAEQALAHATWVETLPTWAQPLAVLGAVILVVGAGRFVVGPVFRLIARTQLREIFTAAALLLVIGIALLMARVGLSPALGTFLAGVVLANSEYRHELESDIEPFKGLLLGLFFLAVGASMDFALILRAPLLIGGIVLLLLAGKALVLGLLGRVFGMKLDQNVLFALALCQGGEFAFVLFSFATQNGIVPSDVAAALVAAVAISMATTPLFMLLNEKLIQPRFGTREQAERRADDALDEDSPVIIAGFGRVGSIVGRLFLTCGVQPTILDIDSDHVDLLRRLGFKVFYGDACRADLLRTAGAARARLIVLALDDTDKILELVQIVRRHFPGLTIMARAHSRPAAYRLLDAGVDHVYRDTLDTSLRLGVDVLRLIGMRAYQAQRQARIFRQHDEEGLRKLARARHDERAYLNLARQLNSDLEQVIRGEIEQAHGGARDAAWDTASLRAELGPESAAEQPPRWEDGPQAPGR